MSEIVCPTGFVIPDNPDNPLVEYVNRTLAEYGDCAFSCVSHPRYTPAQYDTLFAVRLGSVIFSGTVAFIAVNLWSMDRKNFNNNFFVILYGCNMFVGSCMLGHVCWVLLTSLVERSAFVKIMQSQYILTLSPHAQ